MGTIPVRMTRWEEGPLPPLHHLPESWAYPYDMTLSEIELEAGVGVNPHQHLCMRRGTQLEVIPSKAEFLHLSIGDVLEVNANTEYESWRVITEA